MNCGSFPSSTSFFTRLGILFHCWTQKLNSSSVMSLNLGANNVSSCVVVPMSLLIFLHGNSSHWAQLSKPFSRAQGRASHCLSAILLPSLFETMFNFLLNLYSSRWYCGYVLQTTNKEFPAKCPMCGREWVGESKFVLLFRGDGLCLLSLLEFVLPN